MDSFNTHKLKSAKVNSLRKYRNLQKVAIFFRLMEICIVLILISKFSVKIPVSFKNSGEYFRGFSDVLLSPRFVFVIGNGIIIALFANSGQFSSNDSSKNNPVNDLYEEFIQKSEKNQKKLFSKNIRRSQPEKINRDCCEKSSRGLRRRETESCGKIVCSSEPAAEGCGYDEDGMSNEEFRRTIEAFIARQQRLRKEEEFSVFSKD